MISNFVSAVKDKIERVKWAEMYWVSIGSDVSKLYTSTYCSDMKFSRIWLRCTQHVILYAYVDWLGIVVLSTYYIMGFYLSNQMCICISDVYF